MCTYIWPIIESFGKRFCRTAGVGYRHVEVQALHSRIIGNGHSWHTGIYRRPRNGYRRIGYRIGIGCGKGNGIFHQPVPSVDGESHLVAGRAVISSNVKIVDVRRCTVNGDEGYITFAALIYYPHLVGCCGKPRKYIGSLGSDHIIAAIQQLVYVRASTAGHIHGKRSVITADLVGILRERKHKRD